MNPMPLNLSAPLRILKHAAFPSFDRTTSKARKAGLSLFSVAVLLASSVAAMHGQSAIDGFDAKAGSTVNVVVVQPDGKILIGGDFTTLLPNGGGEVTRNHIARLNPDGTLDTAFDPNVGDPNVEDCICNVYSIAVQADGKILVGGLFGSIGGQTRRNIARLDATTGLADSFNPGAIGAVDAIAVQADGKILVGGEFSHMGGQRRDRIARLDATTGLPDSFDPDANDEVFSIAVQADGKILVGGWFTSIGGQTRNRIARLDAMTGLPDSFDPNSNGPVYTIAVQADGKVLAGGQISTIGGQPRKNIARLDATTGLADSFDPDSNGQVLSIAVQADGKILVGGRFFAIGGQTRNRIARLDVTTGLADSFDPNAVSGLADGYRIVRSIAVQADGKILAGGFFTALAPNGGAAVTKIHIARLETDGRLDRTLDLSVDPTFYPSDVRATAVQPDGKILIGGDFTTVLGVARNSIARLNTDGTLDAAFDPNANGDIWSLAVQADGTILVVGTFTSIGGEPRNYIARLDGTTGLADSFNPNANDFIFSMAVQADGKILVGGLFHTIGGQFRNRIARLDPTTGLADSFDPGTDFGGGIKSMAVQADGKILAGGNFTVIGVGGQPRNYIARLDATTGLADSFNPNANNEVFAIAVQADGRILAGGAFTRIGGEARNGLARLDPTIGLADSFDPHSEAPIFSMAVQADGKILAGGNFLSIGGQPRSLFARLTNDTAALQNLAVTQTTIIWTRGGSSPLLWRVTFEQSTDSVNYTPLGSGTSTGSNWTLTGLNLPTEQNIYIRARGYYRGGYHDNSESITESVRNAFLAGPPGTPTPTPPTTPSPTPPPTPTPTPTTTPTPTPSPTPTATLHPITVTLPTDTFDTSVPIATVIIEPVAVSQVNTSDNLIGFECNISFDETVVSFSSPPVQAADLTGTNWNVSGNVLTGPGPIRTLKISAFSNTLTPLNGSGTLFHLRMLRVSSTPGATSPLVWLPPPDQFFFITGNLNTFVPTLANGLITITGPQGTPSATPTATATATPAATATPTATATATPTATATATATPTGTPSGTPCPTPVAPTNLVATAISCSQIDLTWTDNANSETGFRIQRSLDGINFTFIPGVLPPNTTTYTASGLTPGTTYYFRVGAFNSCGSSSNPTAASATTASGPAAPTNLGATATSSSQIALTWTDNANNETGYRVQRSTNGINFVFIPGVLPANTTTYTDSGRTPVTTYYYRVGALNACGNSASSNIASATTSP